jgi:hypothetical protein
MKLQVALHDHESKKYPNLALMKLSAFYKKYNAHVEWFNPDKQYDFIYSSKVFTWTIKDPALPINTIYGGTGVNIKTSLPHEIEMMCPDYSLYNCKKSYGFLTRGCIRKCSHCFVPEKEGKIKAHNDIENFARHKDIILMDNNVLASDHGIKQIEKIVKLNLRIDFNQGLDVRLIDNTIARLLSKVKWYPEIRFACDSIGMIESVHKAVKLLRWNNTSPSKYFCYVLCKDYESTIERVKFLKGIYVDPFIQIFRDKDNTFIPSQKCKNLARWVNKKQIYRSCSFEDYKY